MEYNSSSLTEAGGATILPMLNVTCCLFLIVVTPGGKTSRKPIKRSTDADSYYHSSCITIQK